MCVKPNSYISYDHHNITRRERDRKELMNYVGIATPARPTKPPRRENREELMNYVGIATPARPTKPQRREDRKELMNYVGIATPARHTKPPKRGRQREADELRRRCYSCKTH